MTILCMTKAKNPKSHQQGNDRTAQIQNKPQSLFSKCQQVKKQLNKNNNKKNLSNQLPDNTCIFDLIIRRGEIHNL